MKETIRRITIKIIAETIKFFKDIFTIKEFNKRGIEKIIIIGELFNALFSNYLKLRQIKAVNKNIKMDVMRYQKDCLVFSISKSLSFSITTILAFNTNTFDAIYEILKLYFPKLNEDVFNTIFFLILINLGTLMDLPYKIINQFGIAAIHGFNKSTVYLFIMDLLKMLTITNILLGILLYVIMACLSLKYFAIYTFLILFVFQVTLIILVPAYILPLFNKFSDLNNNELKEEIEELAKTTNFPLTKIQVMDQSIRSTKCNAFFTGLGNKKMIVFFDTLLKRINKNKPIIAILAHEIGHWSYNHLLKSFGFLSASQFIMLLFFQIFYNNKFINELYKENSAIKILHFYYLYNLLSIVNAIIQNIISRRHEIEADKFAVKMDLGEPLKEGLKLLLESNKSSEHDDWLYSYINYSHPTVSEREILIDKEIKLRKKKIE